MSTIDDRFKGMKDKAKDVLMLIPEIFVYVPFDFVTVPVRDRVIPRSVKKRMPELACRISYRSATQIDDNIMCQPAEKYKHENLFPCSYYNHETGGCRKVEKPKCSP